MCGIAGMVGLTYTDEICDKMLKTMQARGPDANGYFRSDRCCLLHSRLSVIDISGGAQPMKLSWGNENYNIVYNGELYNTDEIRNLLIDLGHHFNSHSDTEVVLHAYAQWAEKCVHRFNGIFAFAVWEDKRKKLFVARDRMGVKPLFYKLHDRGLLFASEIKTILAYPTVKAQIDNEGICEIFLLGPGRSPGGGVFKNIFELEPGTCGYYFAGKWCMHRYWKLMDREHTESFEETAEQVRYLVTDAIKRQMVSDVPIGTFLSGGLDSSLISSVCSREMNNRGEKLKTFSLDYKNNDKYFASNKFQLESDANYIHLMANVLDSDHSLTVLTVDDLIENMDDATLARDLPGMADVDISLLVFCREINKKVKVALSGECADEIFGGYPWYRDPEIRSLDGFPWSQNIDQRSRLIPKAVLKDIDPKEYVYSRYKKTINCCDILPNTDLKEKRMKEMMVLNTRWFMQTLLDRKDRMSMYSGLEVRVPFCDHRIAEYLYSVPWEYKDYNHTEKGLLRYAMADYLPEQIKNRRKSPYPKTYDPQFMAKIKSKYTDMLDDQSAPIFAITDKSAMVELGESELKWPWYGQLMKEPQTLCYMLQVNSWLKYYNVDIL